MKGLTEEIKYEYDEKTKKLKMEIDLSGKGTVSGSGKSMVLASTRGNVKIADFNLGVNIYRKI